MILSTKKLRKEFPSGETNLVILDDISFNLEEGKSLAITGPSGSGKSTLLSLLAGLDTATSGDIILDGINLYNLNEEERAVIRKDKVGFVFQSFELLPSLTALENVMLPSELKSEDDPEKKGEYFLNRVGLSDRKNHYPNQLSGGEQQRVAIARALIAETNLILADEPTGNLDPDISIEILKLFEELNKKGTTIIFATHSQEIIKRGEHRIINLSQGKAVES